jgi:murein DD-endopeptidase MepM/ murein hydrolase activator NlpD
MKERRFPVASARLRRNADLFFADLMGSVEQIPADRDTASPCVSVPTGRASSLVAVGREQRRRTFGLRLDAHDRAVWAGLSTACQSGWGACTPAEQSSIEALRAPAISDGGRRRQRTAAEKHERLRRLSGRIHAAMDVASPRHTPVFAPIAGVVTVSGSSPGLFGEHVMLLHRCPPATSFGPAPVVTLYAHLQARDVLVGAEVAAGQQIGRVGDSGGVAGVHLHFSVRHLNQLYGAQHASSDAEEEVSLRINPARWLAEISVPVGPAT